jgi:hypothetical protein
MILSSYKILFSLNIIHTYFENSICNSLSIKVNDSTKKLMSRFGFKTKMTHNVFQFYTNGQRNIGDYLSYITHVTQQDFFEFEIFNTNNSFNLLTDFPIDWMGLIEYSSDSELNVNNVNSIGLNPVFVTSVSTNALGKIRIYFKDILKSNLAGSQVVYEIKFNARNTQWQYFIINKSNAILSNPVISNKSDIVFEGPVHIDFQTGEKALMFTSGDILLPMSQIPNYKFDLINKVVSPNADDQNLSKSVLVFKSLPIPNPKNFEVIIQDGNSVICSPMYVYL